MYAALCNGPGNNRPEHVARHDGSLTTILDGTNLRATMRALEFEKLPDYPKGLASKLAKSTLSSLQGRNS